MVMPSAALCVVAIASPISARAGEQLTQAELVDRASAIAEVEVHLDGRRGIRTLVTKWLVEPAEQQKPEFNSGLCLPSRQVLRQWRTRYKNFPRQAQRLWRQAERRGCYRAVVFLRQHRQSLQPTCEVEAIRVEHWTRHPRFTRWRKRLMQLINKRASKE